MISAQATSTIGGDPAVVATNLRRLMAKHGLTFDDVVAATELDERTLRSVIRGSNNSHARTLHKLATGLGIEIDDLFQPAGQRSAQRFDQATNLLVKDVVADNYELFANWTRADFDELCSRFGVGGQLSEEGVLAAAHAMNAKRDILQQVNVLLESGEAKLLAEFVELLYRRTVTAPDTAP